MHAGHSGFRTVLCWFVPYRLRHAILCYTAPLSPLTARMPSLEALRQDSVCCPPAGATAQKRRRGHDILQGPGNVPFRGPRLATLSSQAQTLANQHLVDYEHVCDMAPLWAQKQASHSACHKRCIACLKEGGKRAVGCHENTAWKA